VRAAHTRARAEARGDPSALTIETRVTAVCVALFVFAVAVYSSFYLYVMPEQLKSLPVHLVFTRYPERLEALPTDSVVIARASIDVASGLPHISPAARALPTLAFAGGERGASKVGVFRVRAGAATSCC
jgi:hypothetical protein